MPQKRQSLWLGQGPQVRLGTQTQRLSQMRQRVGLWVGACGHKLFRLCASELLQLLVCVAHLQCLKEDPQPPCPQ